MLKGVHLTMMMGPVIPVPVPQVITDAMQSINVENGEDKTTFQISFRLGKRSPLQTVFLLTGGVPLPLRVVLIATLISLGGPVLSGKDLDKVASLPTREQALSQLLGVMKAPIEKLVRMLAAPHTKLVRTIDAVRAQKAAAGV